MVFIVEAIKEIPVDFNIFFEQFIKNFTAKTFSEGGTDITIIEIGPREEKQTKFQLLPATSMEVKFPLLFEQKPYGIEVSLNLDIEMITAGKKMGGKLAKKMLNAKFEVFEAGLNNQLSMLIKMSIAESLKQSEGALEKTREEDPLKILKLQFVNGEISEDEYKHKKKLLEN